MKKSIGILLTNTGTPDSPAIADVRRYLISFLSDSRVVQLPGLLWKPLLHTLISHKRAAYSAQLYEKIWTPQGSPLRSGMLSLAIALEKYLTNQLNQPIWVEVGMHYGNPSIQKGVETLRNRRAEKIVVLPLFPQYSTSTTGTTHHQVKQLLKKEPEIPCIFIPHYAENDHYIDAICQKISIQHNKEHYLLFSFHGLPQRFINKGDPYHEHCQQTAKKVAALLELPPQSWSVSYQSRFGYAKWLAPYTFTTLQELPQRGFPHISVVCPGFAIDCLETLEEIQIRGKHHFLQHGGKSFHYIPALNASRTHIEALSKIFIEANDKIPAIFTE